MNSLRSPAPGGLFNLGNKKNNSLISAANTVATNAINAANTVVNAANSSMNTTNGVSIIQVLLVLVLLVVIILFGVFWKNVNASFTTLYEYVRQTLGAKEGPIEEPSEKQSVINKPEAPQDTPKHHKDLVEKILPGKQEVFNISKNSYTYYDAEPLCKALGAELATYEQVKQAYSQGADWCNYGWVKGQMAVYPTQKATWDILQSGPEKDRLSCGRPGLNGGFFDNPELRYGVNCYGAKPDQKDHDATAVASGSGAPLSPGELEQERKVAKYRGETNYISVLPFNRNSWSG